jgi:tight adherence protein B
MVLPVLVFFIGAGLVLAAYAMLVRLQASKAEQQIDDRLSQLAFGAAEGDQAGASIVLKRDEGPLPALDRLASRTQLGQQLTRLIEQSGVKTTPGAMIAASLGFAVVLFWLAVLIHQPIIAPLAGIAGACLPFGWLAYKRSKRMKKFEEQFPDALDLLSRAMRAGHAFPIALRMAAEELPSPSGPEFKVAFEQQNFGLPLRDALDQLATRVPLLDVRFFVTAVAIQRETGGNLAEILDNLANVVRARFKLLRQVRVHTAHGRFTGYVLVCMPAFLAVVLTIMNREFMMPLFHERMGQLMLSGTIVMQVIGFFWIKKIINIEV